MRGEAPRHCLPCELQLPNERSPLATPTTLEIDLRYADLRVWERWTWERFTRLCNFLNVTPAELASIACIPHNQLRTFESRNRVMQGRVPNRAAALVLTLLEAHVCAAYTKDVVTNPFPNLNAQTYAATSSPAEAALSNQGAPDARSQNP